ncbi:MAG: hypothetical protein ABI672_18700 [Vicinamibacteria bacterium]
MTLDEAGGADRDLNFALLPDERRAPMTIKQLAADAGLKLEGLGRLHLEINAEQSVKHFGKEGPLGDFVGMHESSKKKMEKLRSKVSGRRAIATGLLALDLDHEVFTELHPLYSLAWQQPCDAGGKTREIWDLIFANSGAQGWVSSGLNHYLGLLRPSFTIEFPTEFPESDTPSLSAMEIAKVVEEANAKLVASRDGGVKYKIIATQARRVALQLLWSGEITTDVRVHGTVTLNWPRPVTCPDSKGGSIGYPKSHRIEDSAESLEALRGLTESDRAKGFNATEEKDDLDLDETQVARCENCGELEWRGKPEPSECAPAKVCDYFPLDKSHPTQAVTLGRELRGICAAPSVNRLRGLLKRKASSDTDLASLQRLCDALTKK